MKSKRQSPAVVINFRTGDIEELGQQFRAQKQADQLIPAQLKQAFKTSVDAGYQLTRAVIRSVKNSKQFVKEGTTLFNQSLKLTPAQQRKVIAGFIDEARHAGGLFLIQNMSQLKKRDVRKYMKNFLAAGGSKSDVSHWLRLAGEVLRKHNIKHSDTAEVVVDAVGDAANWVVDALEDGVDALLEGIDAIIDAVTTAGAAIVDLFEEVAEWTAEQMGNLLRALVEAGVALGEFISATFDWAYRKVSDFVQAAFEVGFTIADLLGEVVSESYFVFRRFINGIIVNLGPVGDIMGFVLDQFENGVANIWRSTLLALRFAEANLMDALDWMAAQGQLVINEMIAAWESIGEDLITLYEWALTAGSVIWQAIGEATATLGNSIYYVYNFLRTSGVQFLFDVTRGLLRAGQAVAGVIGWAVDQAVEICAEVVRGALDVGVTIGQMLAEVVTNPGNALNTFLTALNDIGTTLEDVMNAVFVETAREFMEEVVDALVEIGNAYQDILMATFRVSAAALSDLIALLFNKLGSYRGLTNEERQDARLVFGNSLDYDLISVSTEDPLNEIVFGIQDFFSNNPDSRAFVTGNLINFDVDDGIIDRPTLIHELTHVWQHRETGGIYMAEAIWAQVAGSGYNYGYFQDDQRIATADGNRTTFRRRINTPITPDTCQVLQNGELLGNDDGAGNILDNAGNIIGAINYTTGDCSLIFGVPPDSGTVFDLSRVVSIAIDRNGTVDDFLEGPMTGTGGENDLNNAAGDFDSFNPEQQGQILMHWFVRNSLTVTGNTGAVIRYDNTAWDPYRAFVRAS